MSQHPSLRIDSVGTKHRCVLKRHERIKKMQADNKWQEGRSAFGLPKVKSIKIKVKKVKEPKEAAEAAAAPGAPAATAPAQAAAPAEKAAAKPAAKPAAKAPSK
jgi:small basic protein (TIGR04137 family)